MSSFAFKKPNAYKNVNTTGTSVEPVFKFVESNKKFYSCTDMMDSTTEVTQMDESFPTPMIESNNNNNNNNNNVNYSKYHYLHRPIDKKPDEYKSINSSAYQNLPNYVNDDLADKITNMEI